MKIAKVVGAPNQVRARLKSVEPMSGMATCTTRLPDHVMQILDEETKSDDGKAD